MTKQNFGVGVFDAQNTSSREKWRGDDIDRIQKRKRGLPENGFPSGLADKARGSRPKKEWSIRSLGK